MIAVEKKQEYVLDELEEYDPEEVKEALDGESDMAGYLFKCLHCDKYESTNKQ